MILNLIVSFYWTHVYIGTDLWLLAYVTDTPFADLTDVALALIKFMKIATQQ